MHVELMADSHITLNGERVETSKLKSIELDHDGRVVDFTLREDWFLLAMQIGQAEEKLSLPITHLVNVLVELLGLKEAPNYKYDDLWYDPLSDLLNMANKDIDKAERALREAYREAWQEGLTVTTAKSLHGLAVRALAEKKPEVLYSGRYKKEN